jgi:hypothetical protein
MVVIEVNYDISAASGDWRLGGNARCNHPLEVDRSWTESCGVNPLDGTNYLDNLDTVSAFIEGSLHLLAGEVVWGRGRHLSPLPTRRHHISTPPNVNSAKRARSPDVGNAISQYCDLISANPFFVGVSSLSQ